MIIDHGVLFTASLITLGAGVALGYGLDDWASIPGRG
jgi:hypothetical protein